MKVAWFELFGPAHLWTLTLIAIAGAIIVVTVRLAGNPGVARCDRVLACGVARSEYCDNLLGAAGHGPL